MKAINIFFANSVFFLLTQSFMSAITITDDSQNQSVSIVANMPADKDFLTTQQNSILKYQNQIINITATGKYNGSTIAAMGIVSNALDNKVTQFNNRTSITFKIDTTGMQNSNGSIFFVSGGSSSMRFDTNLTISFAAGSNIGMGVFLSDKYRSKDPSGNDQTGIFTFNKNLVVDTTGTTGSGYIFNLNQQEAKIYVNYQPSNTETINATNLVQLTGDINLNGKNTILGINLTNNNSYIKGKEDYTSGSFNLNLENGGKWIVTSGNVNLNTLKITNNSDPNNNADLNSIALTSNMSMIDIASQRIDSGFDTQREININTLKSGDNGVFRIMIDLEKNAGDLITIQNQETQNATQQAYIQVLQKTGYKLTQNAEVKVAQIINGGDNLSFSALPVQIGLFDYTPQIAKERQGSGYKWVIYERADTPPDDNKEDNEVQNSIKRLLSLQYRIYRIQTDSIDKHIDELVFTSSQNNFWANYFIGGQSYDNSHDNYQTFQTGYDWGMNAGKLRHFVGGLFDYTHMKDYDTDYNGQVESFGLGAYYQAAYQMDPRANIEFDAKMKYAYNKNYFYGKNNLNASNFVDSYHLFYMGARLGSKILFGRKGDYFVYPSANAGIGFMSGGYINIVDQITRENFGAQQDSATIFSSKINISLGKSFQNYQNYYDIRAKAYYAYDNNTGGDILMVDVNPANSFYYETPSDHRMGIGIEANASFNNIIKLYGSFERTFFSRYNTTYLVQLGIRISLDDLFYGRIFKNLGKRRSPNRTTNRREPKGKNVFMNARPLPKIIE